MEQRTSHLQIANENKAYFGSIAAGDDLMDTILQLCAKNNIGAGMVTCIGSLDQAGFTVFQMENGKTKGYASPTVISEPVELIQATGFICKDENGCLDLHMHGIIEKQDESVHAGHFLRGYNKVGITIEFSIISACPIVGTREFDSNLGYKVINFKNEGE